MKFIHVHHDIIKPDWKVLHVGGGRQPFRRANFVIDNVPYEERFHENSWIHSIPEFYKKSTWIMQPIEQFPWPFEDEEFDYVLIDSALVMSRDPVGVCFEMERVAKRGYIEIPSVVAEHVRNIANEKFTGYPTHRWIGDVQQDKIRFYHKHPIIHMKSDFWIENPMISKIPFLAPKYTVQALFWEESLQTFEDYEAIDFPDWHFENNVWKYKEILAKECSERNFWKISEPVPVLLENLPFTPGKIISLQEIPHRFSIQMVNDLNQRTNNMLNFEQIIAQKMKKQNDIPR